MINMAMRIEQYGGAQPVILYKIGNGILLVGSVHAGVNNRTIACFVGNNIGILLKGLVFKSLDHSISTRKSYVKCLLHKYMKVRGQMSAVSSGRGCVADNGIGALDTERCAKFANVIAEITAPLYSYHRVRFS